MTLGTHQTAHLLMRELLAIHLHDIQGLAQSELARQGQGHVLVVVAINTGHAQLLMFLRDHAVYFGPGLAVIVVTHLLFKLRGIGRLTGETDTAGTDPGRINLQLVLEHIGMAARLIILHTKAPAIKEQGHIGKFGELVIGNIVGVKAFFVLALAGFGGFLRHFPEVVMDRIGLAPFARVNFTVGNLHRLHRLHLFRGCSRSTAVRLRPTGPWAIRSSSYSSPPYVVASLVYRVRIAPVPRWLMRRWHCQQRRSWLI